MTESDELSVVQDRGFSFSRAHLSVVGALIIVGLLFAGWAILRARPVALATPLPVEATTTAPRSPSSPTEGSATPAAEIMVHVLGAVRQPGVVTLPDRARVRDAIERAGGLRRTADPSDLNLAQVLVDGQQLVIGTEDRPEGTVRDGSAPVAGGPPSAGTSVTTVDLNTATEAQLDQLPGVGPVTAERILAWRAEQGRFTRVEELQEVDGIGPKTYAQIAPLVRV
jgi:competence protein ComEA